MQQGKVKRGKSPRRLSDWWVMDNVRRQVEGAQPGLSMQIKAPPKPIPKYEDDGGVISPSKIFVGPLMLNPHSKYRLTWDIIIVLLIFYNVFMIPFRLAFLDSLTSDNVVTLDDGTVVEVAPGLTDLDKLELSFDCIFMMDIVLNFRTAISVVDDKGTGSIISSSREVARRYVLYVPVRVSLVTRRSSWFLFDVVGSVPVDAIFSSFDSTKFTKLFRLPRVFKFMRLLRLLKLTRLSRMDRYLEKVASCGPAPH